MFCNNCGKETSDTANFCPSCGAKLDSRTRTSGRPATSGGTTPNPYGRAYRPKEESNMNKFTGGAVQGAGNCCGALMMAQLCSCCCSSCAG